MRGLLGSSLCSILAVAGLFWLVPERGRSHKEVRLEFDTRNDPKPGIELDALLDFERDALGRSVKPEGHRTLLVHGGTCTGCSLKSISFAKLPVREFEVIFVVYQSTNEEVRDALANQDLPDNVFAIADPASRVYVELNAQWTGRWYVFENDRLTILQSEPNATDWGVRQ